MSVWHRFLVWMCLRSPSQPEIVQPEITSKFIDRLIADAKLIAEETLLQLSQNPTSNIVYRRPGTSDLVFGEVVLYTFEQPGGYRAVFLRAEIDFDYRPTPLHLGSTLEDYVRNQDTKYQGLADNIAFERAFFKVLGFDTLYDVPRCSPEQCVPLVGQNVTQLPERNNGHQTTIVLQWIVGDVSVTTTPTDQYTPENHTALLEQQQLVQTKYRQWLTERLLDNVRVTADDIVKQLSTNLSNTSNLMISSRGTLVGDIDSADGYAYAFELRGRKLKLWVRDYIRDGRYRPLAMYLWDLEQFDTVYQKWLRDALTQSLLDATGNIARWEVDIVPITYVHGDQRQYISFTLQEKVME